MNISTTDTTQDTAAPALIVRVVRPVASGVYTFPGTVRVLERGTSLFTA